MSDAEPRYEHALDEGLRGNGRQLGVERLDERHVEPEFLEQHQLSRQRRQSKLLLMGLEEFAGVRLEHHGRGGYAPCAALRLGFRDQGAMTAVDAVKIANGYG